MGLVAEERSRLDVEAVGRAERLGLDQHAVENHRHREAEHREEDVAIARQQESDQECDDAGRSRADGDQEKHVPPAGVAAEQRHRIGAGRVEQCLPKRHETGPPQDHEPEHDQRIGERDGGERHQPGRQRRRGRGHGDEGEGSEQVRA